MEMARCFLDDSSQNDDMFANEGEHFETANSDASTAKAALLL